MQAILFDLAGVLYQDDEAVAGAVETLARLRQSDIALRFVTNTSRRSSKQVLEQLQRLGFAIEAGELYTAPGAVVSYLREKRLTCHALVHPNLDAEFAPFTSETPDAVVVADAGERFDYARLNRAFGYLMAGAQLLAIGDNRYFRQNDRFILDAGPFIHALAYAADIEPVVIGKPAQMFFRIVLDSVGCNAEQALMIGDDVDADVEGALRAGMRGCLVKTGKYKPGDEKRCSLPGLTLAADVNEAVRQLLP